MTTPEIGMTAPFCSEATVEEKIALKQDEAIFCDTHVAPLEQVDATEAADVEVPLLICAQGPTLTSFPAGASTKRTDSSVCELEETHVSTPSSEDSSPCRNDHSAHNAASPAGATTSADGATPIGTSSVVGATPTGTPTVAGATPDTPSAVGVTPTGTSAVGATTTDTSAVGATPTGTPSVAGATPDTPSAVGATPTDILRSAVCATPTGTPTIAGATQDTPSAVGVTPTDTSAVGATPTCTTSVAGATQDTPSAVGAIPTGTSAVGATPTGTPAVGATPTDISRFAVCATPTGTPSVVGTTPDTPSAVGATPADTSAVCATPTGIPSVAGATADTPSAVGATPTGTPAVGVTPTDTSAVGATPTGTPSVANATPDTPSAVGATPTDTSAVGATPTGTPSVAGATTDTPSVVGATPTDTSAVGATPTGTPTVAGATPDTPSAVGATPTDTSAVGATPTGTSAVSVASDDNKTITSNPTQQSALRMNANQDSRFYHCREIYVDSAKGRSQKVPLWSHPSPEKDCVLVTFHVIVPRDLWGWDENSCVHLCFGHKLLGGWRAAHGEFSMRNPSSAEPNCEMICTVPIKTAILKDPLPYKYLIFSPKVNVDAWYHCYEFLYGHSKNHHGHNNRCLVIEHAELIAGESYLQYDTVAYPCEVILASAVVGGQSEEADASRTDAASPWYYPANVLKALSSAFAYATKKANSSVAPSHHATSLCSMSVYLRPYAEALCGGSYTSSLTKVAEEINHIYSLMSCPLVINDSGVKTNPLQLSQEIQQYFVSILETLQSKPHVTQLRSAVAVMFCVSEGRKYYQLELLPKDIASALKMIRLMPHEHQKTCSDLPLLHTWIPEKSRHAVGEAVLQFCMHLFTSGKHQLEWLEALPLVHFLKGSSKPFAQLPSPNQLQWVYGFLQQQTVGKYEIDGALKCYQSMQDLFALDPLLLPIFINMCPKRDLRELFKYIPLYVSTAYASYTVSTQGWSQAEVDECSVMISDIRNTMKGHCAKREQLMNMLESCAMLLNEITMQIRKTNKGHTAKLPNVLLPLVLEMLSSYQTNAGVQSDGGLDMCVCFEVLDQLVSLLEGWITCKDVMGDLFGGKEDTFFSSWKGKDELKLWHEILKNDCLLSGNILDKWNALVHNLIQKRVHQLSDKAKLKLVCFLEESGDVHPLLVDIVFNCGAEGIDSICGKGGVDAVSQINDLMKKESERIGKLTSRILTKKYPNIASNSFVVSFDDLMDWEFWPCFIKIFRGRPKIKEGLEQPCIKACKAAVDRLNLVCRQLASADILVKELLKITEKKSVMTMLCEAVESPVMSVAVVKSNIERRMKELQHYRSHCDLLRYFLSTAQIPAQTQGLHHLTEELGRNISCQKLNTICTREQSGEVEVIFPAAGALNVFVDKYHIMTSDYPSSIFNTFWKHNLSLETNCTVDFSYLQTHVWNPTLQWCQTIIDQCRNKSITLQMVDALLKHLRCEGDIEVELTNLAQGCALLHGSGGLEWVQDTCALIRNYWMLCRCRGAAALVLDLKNAMHLNGNFQDVDMLSKGIDIVMETSELSTISDELIKTGQFLKSITSHKDKELCLSTFLGCLDIREWLRSVTKGVTELNRFVTIALSTGAGGEDALTQDKLSNLRTVGSGFAPLIYMLSENAGFNEFSMQCSQVWKAVESNKDLPSLLGNCKTCLNWYKHVRETQGSVEESSFAQLDTIQSNGLYVVGLSPQCNIEDVVNVKIITPNESLPKMRYSLDELKDLESRLILITSSKAKDRDKVDQYTDTLHSIVRIAEVLMELKHEGNVAYNEWTLECQCKANPDFDCRADLQRLATIMEQKLQQWRQELKRARDTYYALNYYTNAQLLVLRENLIKQPCPVTVLELLQSISPRVTRKDVCYCLRDDVSTGDGFTDNGHHSVDFDHPVVEMKKGFTISVHQEMSPPVTLEKLGKILQSLCLRLPETRIRRQAFPCHFVTGSPNLIVVNPSNVLKTVLSLYMADMSSPLPVLEEVLLCDQHTNEEEALLLFRRSIGDPEFKRIFCLVHAERLSFQVADNVLKGLDEMIQGHLDYRLVIICGAEAEDDSHIITKLQQFQRPGIFVPSDADIIQYLKNWFDVQLDQRFGTVCGTVISRVQVVSSTRCGMGKSLYVRKIKENMRDSDVVCVPVHGPAVTSDLIMELLLGHTSTSRTCTIFHFDIDPCALHQVDSLLFSLLVLKGLTDSHGNIWRCSPHDIYVVEVTFPLHEGNTENVPASGTQVFLNLLPSIQCLSPLECMRRARDSTVGFAMIDRDKFQTDEYQLVNRCLANFHSVPVPKSLQDQLRLLMMSCGLKDPSWSEMAYFTSFLAVQLKTCEKSDFCRVIHGLNDFAVKFMIRMSRDFSTPSLHGEFSRVNEEQQQIQDEEADDILRFQIEERKKWEQSSHPYLFFNNDGHSMTFVGFIVMPNGDLVDPGREAPQMISAGVSAVNCGGLPQYPVQGMVDRAQYNAQHIEGHGYQYGMDEPAQYSMRQRMEVQQLHAYPRQGMGGQYSGQATGQVGYNHLSMPAQMRPYRYVGTAAQCIIESRIMTPNLYMDLHGNGVKFDEDYRTWNKGQMIQKIAFVMGREYHMDPDPSYALTADNLIKILAIQMRFRCGIPVVIMGESGCGKTRLIQYMCDIAAQSTETRNIFILKVHGGTTQKDITDCIENAEAWAERNQMDGLDTVVFFDEANTTEAIGLIKEIMCDRRMNGRTVSNSLKFIAACNPYRRHSDEMIAKLESAGLGFYVRTSQTQERLGKIPLRHLVYRVLELLPSMRSLVYDYGQLNSKTEADYIVQIVKNNTAALQPKATHAIAAVLSWSQQYMKEQMGECSYVSLRDVKRAMIVFDYFYNRSPLFNEVHPNSMHDNSQKLTHSLVMALAVCYHSRLNDREDYETKVCTQFKPPLILQRGSDQFRKEITRTQAVLLANMEVGLNIAHNAALRENVFMMAVCIELRIPLFLIGKPGSSKSLAKSIISSSMLGRGSAKSLLKEFKEVYMVSYQCSQHSTAESIIDVFKTAEKFQVKQDTSQFVSVVVLDEVGLAEDSPYLPLKALHPLLEDGTLDLRDVDVEQVAFIGISNWALDPAKMNRGVMLTRGQPDIKELVDSAWGICSDQKDNAVIKELGTYFESLAQAYQDVCTENTQREKEFFGLRDFYSLIKMLYSMCCRNKRLPTPPELEIAIRRNFSGKDGFDPTVVFKKWKVLPKQYSCNNAGERDSNSLLGMIRSSLASKESALNGESRYLLFLTENYAALKILFHYLEDAVMTHSKVKPFILFGSSFPKDNEYTQICQNVNQIKLCMETGRTAILLNLETLYESLYDALNQYYIDYGGKRYVDLGLKTHKVKCFVHQDFKLILIAEKKTVYEKFPIPLISRLEKHFVVTSSVFCEWQNDVLKNFEEWTKKMSQVDDHENSSKFTEEEAFVGYQKDTPAALIFQATNHCHKIMEQGKPAVKKAVLHESQQLLLQTVSLDAIVRVNETFCMEYGEIQSKYFQKLYSPSLFHYLRRQTTGCNADNGCMIQVTTHSNVLSNKELNDIAVSLNMHAELLYLHQFETECDFLTKLRSIFASKKSTKNKEVLVIIHCESGHQKGDLIACARYRIYDERIKALQQTPNPPRRTHVVLIIYLPRQTSSLTFVGFQGEPWVSVHIDDLRETKEDITSFNVFRSSVSVLFHSCSTDGSSDSLARQSGQGQSGQGQYHKRLYHCIQPSVAKLLDSSHNHNKGAKLVAILLDLIPMNPPLNIDELLLYKVLVKHVHSILQQMEEVKALDNNWAVDVARSRRQLQQGGTLRNTLIRKIDNTIIPIFAHIIAVTNQYDNLTLFHTNDECSAIAQLWLAIFGDPQIVQFKYADIVAAKEHNDGKGVAQFQCQFPFFWLVKETIDSNHESSKKALGLSDSDITSNLTVQVLSSPIGAILHSVSKVHENQLYERYLHDYVACVYTSMQKDPGIECKLVSDALNGLVQSDLSLVKKLSTLHTVYLSNRSCLMWFGNLVFCVPSILESLGSRPSPWILAAHAVQETVECLNPPLDGNCDSESILKWLQQVQNCLVSVETILSEYPYDDITELRREWHCIRAMQMFLEHIGLKYEGMIAFAKQLYETIGRAPHFGKASTIAKVKNVLKTIDSSKIRDLEGSCHVFFIELVSQLCFGYEAPDKDLIKLLFDTIFACKPGGSILSTRKLSYKMEKDTVPVIRSCLLQLLLNFSSDTVKEYLQQYLVWSEQVIGRSESDKCQLYLLCIKCFQDTIHAKHEHKPLQERAGIASHMLEMAYKYFHSHRADNTLEYIEAVAHTRYGLGIAREALHTEVTQPECAINPMLLTAVKNVCTHPAINQLDDSTANGPIIFLLKEFTKRYGMSFLKQASKRHHWLLPPQLKTTKEEDSPDMFMVYGQPYCQIRDLVADAVYGNKFQQLLDALNASDDSSFLNLALHEIVMLGWQHLKHMPKAIENLHTVIKYCGSITTNMRNVATNLLQSENNLALLSHNPLHRHLLSVVVHTVVVMFSTKSTSLVLPFVTMLTNPATLVDSYMPTMPDDILSQVRSSMSGTLYECPNGHPYMVTECGKPMQISKCHVCHENIGGQNHQPVSGNATIDMQQRGDRTQRGYALPAPEKRSSDPAPERQLSAIACCLIRILMHSALFWTSNSNMLASDAVKRLMKSGSPAPQLLLSHLEKDFETLTRAIKKNELESSALVHALLQHIYISRCSQVSASQLQTSAQRSQWEQDFQSFISPVLKNVEQNIKIAMSSVLNDDKKEYGRLVYIVHEKSITDCKSLKDPKAHAWAYHPNLSIENVGAVFQAQNLRSVCPILSKFLQQEHVLRATQYIPDIFKLRQFLYIHFNHRLDRSEASSQSFGDFLKQVPAHRSTEVKVMLNSLNKAWSLCKDMFPPSVRIPEQLAAFTSKTPLEYLIPTASGAGMYTTLLLDFLVRAHNTFLEECRIVKEETGAERWPQRHIPVAYVQQLHTLDYEAQLYTIITSHCQYSLMTGQGHEVQYDFPGLEKSLVDHFIHGKPYILLEIPYVVYRRDIHSVEQFNKINENLHPQVKLSLKVQQEILGELGSMPRLKESLDTLETVMAFLATAVGVSVDMQLSTYAENLKMQFSPKIQQHCQLTHVLSLWETVSIALAIQHVMRKQEPFDGINDKLWNQNLTVPQTKNLMDLLRQFNLEQLVVGLFQLVSIYIRNASQHEHTTSIVDGMQLFKDIYAPDKEPIPLCTEKFPKDLTLGQAIETWKFIVEYQNRVKPHPLI